MTATLTTRHPTVTVRCPECGDTREITARQLRRTRQDGRQPLCNICLHSDPRTPPTQEHYDYWLERFTIEEIREIGTMIWG